MYWRLLAINPAVAGEIVLADKPAITTDSDRMDRGALDQLLLHTGTLGSIYHKNPEVSVITKCCKSSQLIDSPKTFIKGASGKALTDSPALNAHSRAVLVPIARIQPPTEFNIPDPAPPEPRKSSLPPMPDEVVGKPTPPIPADASSSPQGGEGNADADDAGDGDDDDEDEDERQPRQANDPYSNLDGAFANYLADAPQPLTGSRNNDDDDVLF
jgi:AP-2 complex subunit beta-1